MVIGRLNVIRKRVIDELYVHLNVAATALQPELFARVETALTAMSAAGER